MNPLDIYKIGENVNLIYFLAYTKYREKTIFDKNVTMEELVQKYESKKVKDNAISAIKTFERYVKSKYLNISMKEYFDQIKKIDEHTLYTEISNLIQFMHTEGMRSKCRSVK